MNWPVFMIAVGMPIAVTGIFMAVAAFEQYESTTKGKAVFLIGALCLAAGIGLAV